MAGRDRSQQPDASARMPIDHAVSAVRRDVRLVSGTRSSEQQALITVRDGSAPCRHRPAQSDPADRFRAAPLAIGRPSKQGELNMVGICARYQLSRINCTKRHICSTAQQSPPPSSCAAPRTKQGSHTCLDGVPPGTCQATMAERDWRTPPAATSMASRGVVVRREALLFRMEVRDLRLLPVAAGG